jgi:hypothetical protein
MEAAAGGSRERRGKEQGKGREGCRSMENTCSVATKERKEKKQEGC